MKRAEKAEFNKEIILNAAEELFQKKGFENTKIDEIAERANFSKATIYSYFNCKDELLDRLLHKALVNIIEKIKNTMNKNLKNGEYFVEICNLFVKFYESNKVCFERMLQDFKMTYEGETAPLYKAIRNDAVELNNILYEAMKNHGVTKFFDKEKPEKGAFLLWTNVMGIIMISEQKENVIQYLYGISKTEFRDFSFRKLYEASVEVKKSSTLM
ncbi:MAG: TetR/AcrR family transcriptional regulator [Treponema sp.]|nr:TetR/AcrR family transcriptional regulator [Treponema sp.]